MLDRFECWLGLGHLSVVVEVIVEASVPCSDACSDSRICMSHQFYILNDFRGRSKGWCYTTQ